MTDKPFWRHEVELPNEADFYNDEEYDQAMNMWAHDKLYGLDDDRSAFERDQEYELSLLYDEEYNEDDYRDDDDYYQCGCPYCYCTNMTIGGSKCSECLEGAHQG